MKLSTLNAKWVTEANDDGSSRWSTDEPQPDAQVVIFLCPKCFLDNNGPVGTHSVVVPFADRGVPEGYMPGMARWQASGDTLDTLTTVPSILIHGGCGWHGFITNGEVSII